MADKIDMSLDDIIKSSKGRGGFRRGNFRGRSSFGRSRGTRGGRSQGRGDFTTQRGRVAKRARVLSTFNRRPRTVPDVWEHDLFEGGGSGRSPFGAASAKLLVSNLDFGVNDSDINELFSEFGPLKKAQVNYDRSGRSTGTAEVIFERRGDAARASKQYHNVPLDGRNMIIQLIGSNQGGHQDSFRPVAQRQNFANRGMGRVGRVGRVGRGRGRGSQRGQRGRGTGLQGRTKVPTAEELDAELDAYNSKMEI